MDASRIKLEELSQMQILDLTAEAYCFILEENDFDIKGNVKFDKEKIYERYYDIGTEYYYMPGKPWKRIGLKVMGKYENDDWLLMDKHN